MDYIKYSDSENLTEGQELIINQRIEGMLNPNGIPANFVVKKDDIVIFKRSYQKNEEKQEHQFVVILLEDIMNKKRHGEKALIYGEFIVTNYQVMTTRDSILSESKRLGLI